MRDKIRRKVTKALADYSMIQEGDRVMVAVSGGKDSSILLMLLKEIQRKAPMRFEIQPVILDQHQPGFELAAFRRWIGELGFDLTVVSEDTYSIVKDKIPEGKSYCSLCSRLRRGILYNFAHANGFTKIALGHHQDDLIETLLLNQFYNGRIASMPPILRSDDERNVLIRPMAYVPESELIELATKMEIPVIPCNLCGSQDGLKRKAVKKWIADLEAVNPNVRASLLASIANVRPSQMMDKKIFDFTRINERSCSPEIEL